MNSNNPYAGGTEGGNKHDDMPDIDGAAATAVVKTVTSEQSNAGGGSLLGNLPPLKGGGPPRQHHGPISDPIFLNNKKKPL